jgi:hypothetical protein
MDFDFDEDFTRGVQTGKSSSSSSHKAKTGQEKPSKVKAKTGQEKLSKVKGESKAAQPRKNKKPSKVKGESKATQPRKNKKFGVKKAIQKKRPAATPEMQVKAWARAL